MAALRSDAFFHERLCEDFIDCLLIVKDAEIEVTEWEPGEDFEMFRL